MSERPRVGDDGSYVVGTGALPTGSTLGGPDLCVVLKGDGQIAHVHSLEAGTNLVSGLAIRHWDVEAGIRLEPDEGEGEFVLRPHAQEYRSSLARTVRVEQRVFVVDDEAETPSACYVMLRVSNEGDRAAQVATVAFALVAATPLGDDLEARCDEGASALIVANRSGPRRMRAIVSSEPLASWAVTCDHARTVDERWGGPFAGRIDTAGSDPLGVLHVEHRIEAGATVEHWFAVVGVGEGERATDALARLPQAAEALRATEARYERALARAIVLSPSPEVDLGVRWAKANMLRVMRTTPTGRGFTNDPGRSHACVGRDAAWFVHGCDYVDASFSLALLRGLAKRQESDGKIVEWYDLRTGETHDDGLDVNDDTPLFVIGVWHHVAVTGDRAALAELYPAAARAGEQLLAHRDRRGLVHCSARGTGSRGIAGWRNIIDGQRISGATTEVNSESYAALRRLAELARGLERDDEAERWDREAAALHAAIERHLRNPDNGLYLLAIDVDDRRRSDVTADLVFPLICGVSDDATSARIVARLRRRDFWTPAGVRTISRDAPEYGPARASGLLGGVWVAVTFWFAFGAAKFDAEVMAEALKSSFEHYARDPRATNTVPGQFSEWLHGETLANNGMMLSPWFPPRYVWAAIEGACGLVPALAGVRIAPNLPPGWSWLAARNVPVGGASLSWIVARFPELRLFATAQVAGELPLERYERDVTDEVRIEGEAAGAIAFARGGGVMLFLGNRAPHTVTVAVRLEGAVAGLRARRLYDGLAAAWNPDPPSGPFAVPVSIGRGSFALLEFA